MWLCVCNILGMIHIFALINRENIVFEMNIYNNNTNGSGFKSRSLHGYLEIYGTGKTGLPDNSIRDTISTK